MWLVDIPFQLSEKPPLTQQERNLLLDTYNHLLTLLTSEYEAIQVEIGQYLDLDAARLRVTRAIAFLILTALIAFRAELWNVRYEIEIITDCPRDQLLYLINCFQEWLDSST